MTGIRWAVGTEAEQREDKINFATSKTLERMALLVQVLTNTQETERLQHLQSSVHEMFRQASEYLSQGKTMTIRDSDNDPNWN